jgi:Cell division protein
MNKAVNTEAAAPSRLGVWLGHHAHSIVFSLGRVLGKPWATLLTIMVMALALALPLGLSIALDNLRHFTGSVQQSRDINLFLKPEIDAAGAARVADTLRGRADVAAVTLRTPEEGLAELRENAGLGEAIAALGDNPLPTLLIVTPAGANDAPLAQSLQSLPQADLVQHDALWRQRLDAWLGFGARLVQVLSLLLGLGAILVVGNTVRLDIQSRRDEIGVLQLLGASDGFIRRPFLYLGAGTGWVPARWRCCWSVWPDWRCARHWPRCRRAMAVPSCCTGWICCTRCSSCWGRYCWAGWGHGWSPGISCGRLARPKPEDGMSKQVLKHLISDAPRVMVVDGSKLVRKLIADVLRRDLPGVDVVGCSSIEEAREALAAGPVNLVTTSLALPDGDGLALARSVREAAGQAYVPVIVVSGDAQQHLEERRFTEFVTDYFDKSLGHEALATFIRGYVQPEPVPGATILYVEDSRVVAEATKRMLERQGLRVVHVLTAEDAFALLTAESLGRTAEHIDLVLTDVTLKGELNGRDVVQRIRIDFGYGKRRLPVLVMTGDSNPHNQSELLQAGANDLVQKPIEERLLVTKVLFQLRLSRLNVQPVVL